MRREPDTGKVVFEWFALIQALILVAIICEKQEGKVLNILVDGQTLQSPEINRGIGIYFKNVLNNMIKHSFEHNWYLAVGNKACLDALDPWVVQRVIPIENELFSPSCDYSRTSAYTSELQKIVSEKGIDVFWCPNPLMVNVLFAEGELGCRMYATLYDLIPAIMPVKEWRSTVRDEYNRRLEDLKTNRFELLCISKATKKDFIEHLCQRSGLHVTPLAADSRKFYQKCERSGLREEVRIVFTGGFDYRKNMDGAVQAFARACRKYRGSSLIDRAKLMIVCQAPEEMQKNFYERVKDLGVDGRVMLTGFLTDQELSELYHTCDLFFFPSLYEGFGLPVLEAMLAGAFVLSADNSSLPEVCGGHALLCNADDIENMADRIMEALVAADQESLADKRQRQEYALTFSWEKTARKTLEIFEGGREIDLCTEQGLAQAKKKRVAIMTPWPMQESGIANYVYKLMPYLSKYFDVDIFVDNTIMSDKPFLKNEYGGLYMLEELDQRYRDYDHLLYQMGNSAEHHSGIYRYLKKYPGIAEIHDYILHPFFYHSFFLKHEKEVYKTALVQGYGKAGLHHYEGVRDKRIPPDNEQFPMCHSVAAISKKVIFHNHWSKRQMQDRDFYVIPLACFDKENIPVDQQTQLMETVRHKYGIQRSEILISCFGFVNRNKRPEVVLQVLRQLLDQGQKVKLVFWGKSGIEGFEKEISQLGLQDAVEVTGYLEKSEYEVGLALSDIVINLRYPSMGESSATLCEAFKYGKPVIVTGMNQYCEFPDEICWKVSVGCGEVECLGRMVKYLIAHPDVRQALGQNAQAYADKVLSPDKIAKQYQNILEQVK